MCGGAIISGFISPATAAANGRSRRLTAEYLWPELKKRSGSKRFAKAAFAADDDFEADFQGFKDDDEDVSDVDEDVDVDVDMQFSFSSAAAPASVKSPPRARKSVAGISFLLSFCFWNLIIWAFLSVIECEVFSCLILVVLERIAC